MEDMNMEVPHFFACPISLQIMKDPVTAITGITYDRDSIERWLFSAKNGSCPVTKQPLPPGSGLTPNHTLRRLIQAWCAENVGIDLEWMITTPKPLLSKPRLTAFLIALARPEFDRCIKAIRQLEILASGNEWNRKCMAECSTASAVFSFVAESCFRRDRTEGLEQALSLLWLIRNSSESQPAIGEDNELIMDCFTWILSSDRVESHVKTLGALVLQSVVQTMTNPSDLSRLKPEFFAAIMGFLQCAKPGQGRNATLGILLEACPHGRNRVTMVESDVVFELIELDIREPLVSARTVELVMRILFHLCCCAEGRAQLLGHRGGVAAVSQRILRVSMAVDERAVTIFSLLCRFSGTKQVTREMLEVGAVAKLCVLMQADSAVALKEKVREMLKAHSGEWKDSPCIGYYHHT